MLDLWEFWIAENFIFLLFKFLTISENSWELSINVITELGPIYSIRLQRYEILSEVLNKYLNKPKKISFDICMYAILLILDGINK